MNTKPLRLTPAMLEPLRNIRELKFRKVRSFSDYHLASGYETLDLSQVPEGRAKDLLVEFFEFAKSGKRSRRVITTDVMYIHGKVALVEYYARHGFGYAWSQDLENEFVAWALAAYDVKPTSKTYKALASGRCLLSF